MKALVDEALRFLEASDAYLLAGTVVIEDGLELEAACRKVVAGPGRVRPFHWTDEGVGVRMRMIECLVAVGAVARVVVHHPTARAGHERARSAALRDIVTFAVGEGADELVIEHRTRPQNLYDRITLLDHFATGAPGRGISYGWDTKANPLLWLPDGVCGAAASMLDETDPSWWQLLVEGGVVDDLVWITGA